MNDQPDYSPSDRSKGVAKFHVRIQRWKALLRRHGWIVIACLVITMAIQGALSWFKPATFFSVGRMIVSIKLSIQEASVYTEELSNFLGTQQALMQSPEVINRAHARAAAARPDIGPQHVDLSVSITPKTTIFILRASGADKEYLQTFLQAVMEEYIKHKRELRERTSDTTLARLTSEVLRLEGELHENDDNLAAFQTTNSVVLLQESGSSTGKYLDALNQRLAALKSEAELLNTLTVDQNLDRQYGTPLNLSGNLGPDNNSNGQDLDYSRARQQLLVLKADQQDLGQFLRPKHPKMVALAEEISRRERLLDILKQLSTEQLESKKESLALQIKNLEKDVKDWDAKNLEISHKMAEYQKLKSNQQRVSALYERLLSTMQTLDVNKEISPETVTIEQDASAAYQEKLPLLKGLTKAAIIGLALSFVILFALDRLDDRMNSFTELQEFFDEEVMGQIPFEKARERNASLGLIHAEDERHSFVEAYRNLRSSLLYIEHNNGSRPRTLLVTGSVPNDGKSVTAANLAITLALAGSKTLLVDADLRKGLLHGRFGIKSEPGLSDALQGKGDWRSMVQSTETENLFVLPRGHTTQRSSELFIGKTTREFLEQAKNDFDYVIVDTAPVMAADDVTSLAPLVGGTIFVIRASQTSARVARASLDLLYQRQVNVLGLVFNAVRTAAGDYYYYHRYHDYYKAYPGGKKN